MPLVITGNVPRIWKGFRRTTGNTELRLCRRLVQHLSVKEDADGPSTLEALVPRYAPVGSQSGFGSPISKQCNAKASDVASSMLRRPAPMSSAKDATPGFYWSANHDYCRALLPWEHATATIDCRQTSGTFESGWHPSRGREKDRV